MKLFKFRAWHQLEYVLDIVHHERLHCASYKDLNDPFEGVFLQLLGRPRGALRFFKRQATLDDFGIGNLRVCSLSASMNDVRLWSNYAEGHRGVAIEIDFDDHVESIHEVTYSDELRKLTATILTTEEHDAVKVFTTKTHHWVYEHEFRILQRDEFFDVSGRVRTIHLGTRFDPSNIALLKKVVPRHIEIIQTKLDAGKLEVRDAATAG